MRRGQVTIFIVLGIVIVAAFAILYLAQRAMSANTDPTVTADESLAKTCLSQTTKIALAGLLDDGLLTVDEGGPLGESQPYVKAGTEALPFGINNYYGLCDTDGPNGIGVVAGGNAYPCAGAYSNRETSVQEMLAQSITGKMRDCVEVAGTAEVTMQEAAVTVRWDNPAISHREPVPLMIVWRAIRETVNGETGDAEYVAGETPLECAGCDLITIQRQELSDGSDNLTFLAADKPVASVIFENRPIAIAESVDEPFHTDDYHDGACADGCVLWAPDEDDLEVTSDQDHGMCRFAGLAEEFPCVSTPILDRDADNENLYNLTWEKGCEEYDLYVDLTITDGNYETTIYTNPEERPTETDAEGNERVCEEVP